MVLDKVLSIGEGRKVKKFDDVVRLVATYEPETEDLSDAELAEKTAEFRERLRQGELGLDMYGWRAKLVELGVQYVDEEQ